MLTANEIRKRFLDFFAAHSHTIVPSASLVPPESEDKTVLFSTAGMQQFKRQFLGQIEGYTRAASCQKCLRTDDLDKIGKTAFHHTFFEMLGNFSFGDYFKKEAIEWAWEFLTQDIKLPAEKLWVSVYKDDEEAYNIWLKGIKIPKQKIIKLGDKSNFWPSEAKEKGPNGPCGPCSEIFFDYGVNPDCPNGDQCNPDCNCGRFSEIWNLVFTQFNRKDGGVLVPLPAKNIDTGMGLERLVAVAQGKKSNYETDLFATIIEAVDHKITSNNIKLTWESKCVIGDHIRAIVFGIADGVIPSNDGRGYIIKKLIVESTDLIIRNNNVDSPLSKLVPFIIDTLGEPYPELVKNERLIITYVKKTEEAYTYLLNEKIPILEKEIEEIKRNEKLNDGEKIKRWGRLVFNYRNTYGLALGAIKGALKSQAIEENIQELIFQEFERLMEKQKEQSRAASKMTGDVFADTELNLNVPKTEFLGYDEKNYRSNGKILKLFMNNQEVQLVKKGDAVKVVLDRTSFYAESGGQVGDSGVLTKKGGRIKITDTQKIADVFIHIGVVEEGAFSVNEETITKIDAERRLAIMRNHTATHLLQAALRKVLGTHVQQQGSLVAPDRLRFDFTHPQSLTKEQIQEIEFIINAQIKAGDVVEKTTMNLKEAKETGAMAFFAEKYKDVVRVISVGDYSKELCGGTHLKSTGEIGSFKIVSEGAVAQGIRRIEARTASAALEFMREKEKEEAQRIESQNKRLRELEEKKEMDRQFIESLKNRIGTIIQSADTIHNTKIVADTFPNSDTNQLKQVYDLIKQQVPSVTVCVGSGTSVVIGISGDLVAQGIDADKIIKADINKVLGGKGGGRPELAQASGKDPSKLIPAIKKGKEILTLLVKKALSK